MFHHQMLDGKSPDVVAPYDSLFRKSLRFFLFVLAGSLSSCAGSRFEREWNSDRRESAQGLTGSWEGKWLSESTGHEGKLRCIVKSVNGWQNDYAFQYEATWGKFLRGIFTIQCKAEHTGPRQWKVNGSKDLGKLLGGEFSHHAEITPLAIHAQYHSRLDHGVMDLRRAGNGEISTKPTTPGR